MIGCGPKKTQPTGEETCKAVRAALQGKKVSEETRNFWKRASEMYPERFLEFTRWTVEEECFGQDLGYYQCQKNTWVMKDVEWSTVLKDKPAHVKAFTEGVRIFLAHPRNPIPDQIEQLREQLRGANEAIPKIEAEVERTKEELTKWIKISLEAAGFPLILAAMSGDKDAIRVIKLNDEKSAKELIENLLKNETEGFDKIKTFPVYAALIPASYAELMTKTKSVTDAVYMELIK
jgi:hypothetical protein